MCLQSGNVANRIAGLLWFEGYGCCQSLVDVAAGGGTCHCGLLHLEPLQLLLITLLGTTAEGGLSVSPAALQMDRELGKNTVVSTGCVVSEHAPASRVLRRHDGHRRQGVFTFSTRG